MFPIPIHTQKVFPSQIRQDQGLKATLAGKTFASLNSFSRAGGLRKPCACRIKQKTRFINRRETNLHKTRANKKKKTTSVLNSVQNRLGRTRGRIQWAEKPNLLNSEKCEPSTPPKTGTLSHQIAKILHRVLRRLARFAPHFSRQTKFSKSPRRVLGFLQRRKLRH